MSGCPCLCTVLVPALLFLGKAEASNDTVVSCVPAMYAMHQCNILWEVMASAPGLSANTIATDITVHALKCCTLQRHVRSLTVTR